MIKYFIEIQADVVVFHIPVSIRIYGACRGRDMTGCSSGEVVMLLYKDIYFSVVHVVKGGRYRVGSKSCLK